MVFKRIFKALKIIFDVEESQVRKINAKTKLSAYDSEFWGKIADKKFGSLFIDSPLTIVEKSWEIMPTTRKSVTPEKTANGIKLI